MSLAVTQLIGFMAGGEEAAAVGTAVYVTSVSDTSNKAEYTFAATNIGTASATRYILFAIHNTGSAGDSIDSFTVTGTSCTELQVATGDRFAVYITDTPIATGTTADIVVTFNGAQINCAIAVVALYDLTSSTPTDVDTTGTSGGTITLNPTTAGGPVVVFARNRSSSTFTGTGTSAPAEQYDSRLIDDNEDLWAYVGIGAAVGGSTTAIVTSTSANLFAAVAVAFA